VEVPPGWRRDVRGLSTSSAVAGDANAMEELLEAHVVLALDRRIKPVIRAAVTAYRP
jgi:hypothetical protein